MRRIAMFLAITVLIMAAPRAAYADPLIGGCQVFPLDNPWNADISSAPVHPNSNNYITKINSYSRSNAENFLHADFGENPSYGIPYITVSGDEPKVPVDFYYPDESDPGPYPFPPNAPVEGGGDRHVIAIDTDNCVLYEAFDATYVGGPQKAWNAGSGAIFNLDSNALRPEAWTSADAAGLPIFPGLARCDEVMAGVINHALRFTVRSTQQAYIYPARHYATNDPDPTNPDLPPMGLRLRMKASYDISDLTGQALVIAQALKKYGMLVADNGSNWFISGETNPTCWNDDELNQLKDVPGTAFEVIVSPDPAPVVLPAPSLSSPANNATISSSQPTLIWNTITSAVSYEIQLGKTNPPGTTVTTVASTSPTTYAYSAPLLAGTYYWRVRALDESAAPTGWSPVRAFSVASAASAVPLRTLFTTATPLLTWNLTPWADGYEIQVNRSAGFTGPQSFETIVNGVNTLSVPTSALPPGRYYWRVRARSGGTLGAWSVVDSFVIDLL